ncbi:MAG TPA: TMEM175 family protein [Polyangia bacterium]|nr:TMEM175 family protein [Polyangia bacterium]
MLREPLAARGVGERVHFRWRGGQVSRLEGFSDVVFGFSLTLLVVSLEVPRSFGELMTTMRGFVPFAICFLMLVQVWYQHYKFFRRYGLEDTYTLVLNTALLFVVMFYTYPLKFLFTMLIGGLFGGAMPVIDGRQMVTLMQIYALGFIAVFGLFALLYHHGWRRRRELDLDPVEQFDTRSSILENALLAAVGLLSLLVATVSRNGGLAGLVYFLLPVIMTIFGTVVGARRRRVAAQSVTVEPTSPAT